MPNRLATAASPYLRQHADNPVDWWPWSDEAFEEARRRDVPVFLSIGYATCHWCHVMAHRSFEDADVAAALNAAFVCVKLDREERPDVDAVYMAVCQRVLGHGGWPLTVVTTPDRRPFYVATYLPPRRENGRPGVVDLAEAMADAWQTRRAEVEAAASELTQMLQVQAPDTAGPMLGRDTLDRAVADLRARFDPEHGGFGRAPKFPTPHALAFLLRRYRRTGRADLLEMATTTLDAMQRSGLHDRIGGGFHRYATDRAWTLPHFEKMLYDQAGLLGVYAEAAALTGRVDFAETALGIHAYVTRDLRLPSGLYASAEDADSLAFEGPHAGHMHEGAFYTWTPPQLVEALGEADGLFVARLFGVTEAGTLWDEATGEPTGESLLTTTAPIRDLAPAGDDPVAFSHRVDALLSRLRALRDRRPRPLRDDKALADWNAWYDANVVRAWRTGLRTLEATSEQHRLDAEAQRLQAEYADFDVQRETVGFNIAIDGGHLRPRLGLLGWTGRVLNDPDTREGALLSPSNRGQRQLRHVAAGNGAAAVLDDYAHAANALLESVGSYWAPCVEDLATAVDLVDRMIEDHWDEDRGVFLTARRGTHDVLVNPAERYDGAMPSGNAVAVDVLQRLARLTGRGEYDRIASRMWETAAAEIARHPSGFCHWLLALDDRVEGTREVVIAVRGDDRASVQGLYDSARGILTPDDLLLVVTDADRALLADVAPALAAYAPPPDGHEAAAWAYVCQNFRCEAPVWTVEALRGALDSL